MRELQLAGRLLIALILLMAAGCKSQPAAQSAPTPATQAPAPKGTPLAPSLAKAKISVATAAARKWKSDAVLIQIAAGNIGEDGMAVMWDYGFWSATARTCAVVNVYAGGATDVRESGGETCESPALPESIVDSDEAMKVARANGLTQPKATMIVSALPGRGTFWSVMDAHGMTTGDAMIDIDAESGKFKKKTHQQ